MERQCRDHRRMRQKERPAPGSRCDEPSKRQEMQRRTIRTTHLPFL